MPKYLRDKPKRKLRIKKFKDHHREVTICNLTGKRCEKTNTCHDCPTKLSNDRVGCDPW
jgi:hypothetical protein